MDTAEQAARWRLVLEQGGDAAKAFRVRFEADTASGDAAPGGYLAVERPWGHEQWLPIHAAAELGLDTVLSELLNRGAKADSRTRFRSPWHARLTALHLAAAGGHIGCVNRLLEAGADADVADAQGRTPLHLAAAAGGSARHSQCVRSLLNHGADPEQRDAGGQPPVHTWLAAALTPVEAQPPQVPENGLKKPNSPQAEWPPTPHPVESIGGSPSSLAQALDEAGVYIDVWAAGKTRFDSVCPREPMRFTLLHRVLRADPCWQPLVPVLVEAGADLHAHAPDQPSAAELLAASD